ncbi:MAG: MBL fold metallo-hydrolase [Chloroflexota bacterium]|nr:MAG: MBL fold metallo-hydrolase [Chloroflexota bacterium]
MKEKPIAGRDQAKVEIRPESSKVVELAPGIYQFRGEKPGSHVYLIKGGTKNVLIDTGVSGKFPALKHRFSEIGMRVKDVNLIVLTHEHYDHIGATAFFHRTAVVAAHRLAANKLELQDEFVTFRKYRDQPSKPFWVDIWLEDGSIIDLGNYELQVIHTPGHTSGCICLYEPRAGLLFTGDTVFDGGTLSEIAVGGNVSDYVNSIRRLSNLKMKRFFPGHGRVSSKPDEDLPKAIIYAQAMLDDCKAFFEAFIKTRRPKDKLGSAFGYWTDAQDKEK